MLKYGNRDFRNLQEQVYANMKNIEDIIKGSDITMDYKLNIVAQVAEAADLPDADTYEGNYGDIYIVGEAAPLDAYVFGKVYENENAPSWIELGEIFVEGPQGPQGEPGDAAGFAEPTASASTLEAGSSATVSIVASGPDTAKEFAFTFGIPKGDKGDTGAQGPQGPQGEPGSGTSVSDFVEGTGIVVSSAADNKVEIAVDENKVLVTPESAPAAQQLVGINTSGEQNALGIGEGLEINNSVLSAPYEIIKLNFNNSSTLSISDELYDKLFGTNALPIIIYAINTSYNPARSAFYTHSAAGSSYEQITTKEFSSSHKIGNLKVNYSDRYQLAPQGNAGARKLACSKMSSSEFTGMVETNYGMVETFSTLTGTATSAKLSNFDPNNIKTATLGYKETSNLYVFFDIKYYDFTNVSARTIYGEGESATYKYTLTLNISNGAYTITQTAK